MLYRKMPKNGDELSILGFGAMRLPVKDNGSIDEEKATKMVRHAIDNGVNYVDTAWPYHMGESEPFLARALADGYREKVKLATKQPQWMVKEPEDMDRFLNAQLEKLNTDHIDYYLVHSLVESSWENIRDLGVMEFLDKAKSDGRIINAGFSYHGTPEDFKPIVDAYDWDVCQIQYNFLDENVQAGRGGLEYAASRGLGVVVMEPLRGGNLADPVPSEVMDIWDEADVKRSPAEWALRWVWNHPDVTVVLSGMTEPYQVQENLKVAEQGLAGSLSEKEMRLVDRVAEKYRELMKLSCTECRYCMPCPEGVDIPACFEMYNNLHIFGDEGRLMMMYAAKLGGILRGADTNFASQCTQCGQCLDACPQNLPIPDLLEKVAEEFEGPGLGERMEFAKQLFENDGC
ncbi:aldo/keto reductase [Methanolobus halotolerans]|uniref:Aldo/keto reductase n=1 Tax=Methanolobus halotolerans TaxID=2052935 RepID=A0A4E0PUY2_9EURY|nr:aldo/keto reductase [Methanolobus halotolerans]TGC09023.1 aldo/keto reductase [Methanolobus halotolerans]